MVGGVDAEDVVDDTAKVVGDTLYSRCDIATPCRNTCCCPRNTILLAVNRIIITPTCTSICNNIITTKAQEKTINNTLLFN
jgi:hypothetical protein